MSVAEKIDPSTEEFARVAAAEQPGRTAVLGGGGEQRRRRDRPPTRDRIKPLSTPQDRMGEVLNGTYRIERAVAEGGMGTVYEVAHTRLQQHFAVKFLDPRLAKNREAYARFRQEAEIAASLHHGSIVQVFDFNTDAYGNPYMVMELVEGETLEVWIERKQRVRRRDVVGVFAPLCNALDAAHRHGIVHRDLKPSNVIVRRLPGGGYAVKLLDFGISKIKQEGTDTMTRDNVVMGTPNYMSPEQASGNTRVVDPRTDVFALGSILYEMVSGKKAFEAKGLPQLLHAIVYEDPRPLVKVAPRVPEAVARVVSRCLEKDADKRFSGTRVLLQALKAAYKMDEEARARQGEETGEQAAVPVGRSLRWAAAWAGTIVLATAVGAAWAPSGEDDSELGNPQSSPEPITAVSTTDTEVPRPRFAGDLATPGSRVLEQADRLYRADSRGLTYWPDVDSDPVTHGLPSASPVEVLALSGDAKEVLVGQADGMVSRWSRDVRSALWHGRVGRDPVVALASAGGYLAVASSSEVRLMNASSGKVLKRFFAPGIPVSVFLTRGARPLLLVVRSDSVQLVDADGRRALKTLRVQSGVHRAEMVGEAADGPITIQLDFDQGDWVVARTYEIHRPGKGRAARLEPVGSAKVRERRE